MHQEVQNRLNHVNRMDERSFKRSGDGLQDLTPRRVRRDFRPTGTRVRVGPYEIGGNHFVVIAGPCALESTAQALETAALVARHGAHVYRGGVFKPRSSPYAFQGLGEAGLPLLAEAGRRHGLPVVTEVMDASQLPNMLSHVDLLQVGARNMQNFSLLKALSRVRRPVLLKRGLAATFEEWLQRGGVPFRRGQRPGHPL